MTTEFIANLLAEFLENHAADHVAQEDPELDAALDEHGIAVQALEERSAWDGAAAFRVEFAGKTYTIRVTEAS